MGTNFYAEPFDGPRIHLGKRSAGWRFSFHATDHFRTTRQLASWLENTESDTDWTTAEFS